MAWGCSGYRLVLAEAGMAAQVLELSLAKSPRGSHRILHPSVSQPGSGRPAPSEIHILQVSAAPDMMLQCPTAGEALQQTTLAGPARAAMLQIIWSACQLSQALCGTKHSGARSACHEHTNEHNG